MPPHDALAEQSVLGSMMLSRDAVLDVLPVVEAGDFWDPRHEMVFAAARALHDRELPVDMIAVSDELQRRGLLGKAGGAEYLAELTSAPSSTANAGFHAGVVRDTAVRRRMIDAGMRITEFGFARQGDPHEQLEQARGELDRVVRSASTSVSFIGDALGGVVDEMEAQRTAARAVETPWAALNRYIVGLKPGELTVIGARPSEGKSIIALQLAREMAERGPVAFVSMEMGRGEITRRLISSMASVHMGSISRDSLTQEEWQRVAKVRPQIEGMRLAVADESEMTITKIRSFARSVSRKGQLGGVVVDYLQLVSGARSDQERYTIVTETSRQLKILSRELDCPVVALSQLKRGETARNGKRRAPTLSDLRESGQIEQDADVVILLELEREMDGLPGDNLWLHIAKQRNGRLGRVPLFFEGQFMRVSTPSSARFELPIPD